MTKRFNLVLVTLSFISLLILISASVSVFANSHKANPAKPNPSSQKAAGPANKGQQNPGKSTLDQFRGSERAKSVLLENRGNKLNIKALDETGQELDPPQSTESAEVEIEEPEDQDNITIRSVGNASLIIRNKLAAQTHFPIMVNLDTNELIITTPAGQKVVTILPDQAVQNMLAANVLDQIGGKGGIKWLESIATPSATPTATDSATPTATPSASPTATPSGEPTATPSAEPTATPSATATQDIIILTATEDGELVYRIPGIKFEKLLGILTVTLNRIAVVSAETSALLTIEQNLGTRILDFFSF